MNASVPARSRVALASACVVLAFTAFGCGYRTSTGSPPPTGQQVGFTNGGQMMWESDADLARDLDTQTTIGAKWIRITVDFNSVQAYGPGYWDWTYQDRVMAAALSRGLKVLAMPSYTPTWARQSACSSSMYCPPANPNDFANFVRAAATRYAPYGVHAWEIWNEPNWAPWWIGAPNAAAYVALLKPTYVVVHQVDPGATVVTGGLAPHGDLGASPNDPINPVNYLKAMYAAGAQGYFDAFGVHPYPPLPFGPLYGSPNWNTFLQTSMMHDVMTSFGDGAKKIWGTEYGAPTGGSDAKVVTPDQQAQYIATGVRTWLTWQYTGPLFIDTVRDISYSDPTQWGNFMGVMWLDYSAKPALWMLASVLSH